VRTSTRIILTYRVLGTAFVGLSAALAYLLWTYQPVPNTLEEALRPFGIVFVSLFGLSMAVWTLTDPLARRVVRVLRHKSL
jgi:type IV secretory pathway TrbL component